MTPHALIIDDNRLNIDVLTMLLQKEGVTVTTVEHPRNIAQALRGLPRVDVIFLDLEFPTNDGFEILSDLKRDAGLTGVPVVAYTVHTSEIDKARAAGFDSFIGKPLDTHRFPDQLKRLLAGQAVWEA